MRAATILLVMLALAGCGSSAKKSAPDFDGVRARTTATGSAVFRYLISINAGGTRITAEENGSASFSGRRGHLYKQLPGGQFPQELVIIGPLTYSNANVQAALADPSVPPWTKLDTRRLTAKQRSSQPDELNHVLAPVYLTDGVAAASSGSKESDGTFRYTGSVDPARLARRVPKSMLVAARNDFPSTRFPATFWLDADGRLTRVLVDYTTPKGTKVTVDAVYSEYGSKVDLALPAPAKIKDISP